jgi:transcriptional regulator with XRE-family HTH domain
MTLGRLLRGIREERGWTLRHVAKRAGLSPTIVSRVETDQDRIAPDTLESLLVTIEANEEQTTRAFFLAGRFPDSVLERALASEENFASVIRFVRSLPIPNPSRYPARSP